MQEIPWQSFLKLTSEGFSSLCWFWPATSRCFFGMRDLQDWSQVPQTSLSLLKQHIWSTTMKFCSHSLYWICSSFFFFFAFLHFLSNCKALSFSVQIVIIPSLKYLMFHINSNIDLGAGPFPMFQFFSWGTNSTEFSQEKKRG